MLTCCRCHERLKPNEANYLTVKDGDTLDRNLVHDVLCSSCTYRLRDFLYQDED